VVKVWRKVHVLSFRSRDLDHHQRLTLRARKSTSQTVGTLTSELRLVRSSLAVMEGPNPKSSAGHLDEVVLRDGGFNGDQVSNARRRGDVVLRESGPWTSSVHALLRYLHDVGFTKCPQVLGTGFSDDGRETLSFVPGDSVNPGPWSDEAISSIGTVLAELHRVSKSFSPSGNAIWRPCLSRDLPGGHQTFGHGDLGPWNVVVNEGSASFVDWDFSGPVASRWELAETTWLNCQLHDDDLAESCGLPSPDQRARQVRYMLEAYGLSKRDRTDFVDDMISFAVHSARWESKLFDIVPSSTSAVTDSGFPVMWAITWRVRSASWMITNRSLLMGAIL
jgi:aminoglycoside phosphotransferase